MNGLRVSVVIPCFNAGPYIAEAVASVLGQEPPPDEVIVVDDGSDDDSGDVAAAFGTSVRVLRQANLGISAARNAGIAGATGDLLAFLDADDLWPAGSLALRLEPLVRDPRLDISSGLTRQFLSPELPDETRARLSCPDGISNARVAGSILVRRSAFDRVGPFNPAFRVGETLDWIARADAAGITHFQVESLVLLRRVHRTNTTARLRDQQTDYLHVLKAAIDRRRASSALERRG